MPSVIAQEIFVSPPAGRADPRKMLIGVSVLEKEYYCRSPDLDGHQLVSFSTSGTVGVHFEIDAQSFKDDARPPSRSLMKERKW
jgi:hypothetical protein